MKKQLSIKKGVRMQFRFFMWGVLTIAMYVTNFAQSEKWQKLPGIDSVDVFSLAVSGRDNMIAGTVKGIYHSTDNGRNWVHVNDIETSISSFVVGQKGYIFAGTYLNGVLHSSDDGNTWEYVGSENPYVLSLGMNQANYIFQGTYGSGVYRSINYGGRWKRSALQNNYVWSIAVRQEGEIFVGTNVGVFRSTDNGESWNQLDIGVQNVDVLALAIDNNGIVYAGTDSAGMVFSRDGGESWIQANNGLTNLRISSLAVNSKGDVFAGTFGGGIFCLTNATAAWTHTGLENLNITCITIDPNGDVVCGTQGNGVFRKKPQILSMR